MNKLSPFRWFVLQNFPFIEADFDALTNYELMCKVVEYLNKIITKTNELGNQVEVLTNWFNNLDVQDEINNKLDEMAENGELEEIISAYLNTQAIMTYNSIDELKNAENLIAGTRVQTLGYYEQGDLGSSKYIVREVTNEDDVNDMDIIALKNTSLVAEIIPEDTLNIKQFGAKCDGSSDDSDVIQRAIEYISEKYTPYIQAGSQIELVGNYKATKVTKTIYIPHTLRVRGLYLDFYEGSYDNNYCVKVNLPTGTNISNWLVAYPRENVGYIKECRFYNKTQNAYNGIMNASNNTFEDISMDNFDIFYNVTNNYLDSHKLIGCHLTGKIQSSNYGVYTGFLGDVMKISNCAIDCYDTPSSQNLAIYVGNAQNGVVIENNIIHGNIYAGTSTLSIKNIHMERGKITLHGTNAIIENGYCWKDGSNIICEQRANVKISNFRIVYNLVAYSYQDDDENDITSDTSSNVIIEESYKYMIGTSITGNNLSFLRVSNAGLLNNIQSKVSGIRTKVNDSYPFPGSFNAGAKDNTNDFVKWFEASGTYIYRAVKIIDFERMLAFPTYSQIFDVELTNGEGGMRSTSAYKGSKWRIYRGSSNGSYNKYVDISHQVGEVYDNGYILNGNKWKSRETGDIDSFNTIRNNYPTKYDDNDNITCYMANTPTIGTWKIGDTVITPTGVYTCTTSNSTGGVWQQI